MREEPLKDLLIPGKFFTLKGLILCGEWDVNLYRYCLNNPVNLVDPNGLAPGLPWGLIAKEVCSIVCFGKTMHCHINCMTEDDSDCPDSGSQKKCKVKCNEGYLKCMDICFPQWREYVPKPTPSGGPDSGGGGGGGGF